MSIDREQRDQTFRAVIVTAATLIGVWFLFAVALWIIGV